MQEQGDVQHALSAVAAGDRAAMADVYDRSATDAFRLALLITRDHRRACDVLRSAYVDVWRDAPRHASSGLSARAWILVKVQERAHRSDPGQQVAGPMHTP